MTRVMAKFLWRIHEHLDPTRGALPPPPPLLMLMVHIDPAQKKNIEKLVRSYDEIITDEKAGE